MNIKKIVTYVVVATIYTALSLMMGSMSFAGIQIRAAEILMVMCIFDKRFILPLTFACFITNLIGVVMGINVIPLDIVFGTIATLLSGYLMYACRNIKLLNKPSLSLIVPSIVNGIVIGLEYAFAFSTNGNFMAIFATNGLLVLIGELISVYIMGLILLKPMSNLVEYINSKYQ